MKLHPARGYVFVIPVDDIPSDRAVVGFGGKTDKLKPEEPYKFKVVAVGAARPFEGVLIYSEVEEGDIISHHSSNADFREKRETAGFLVDNVWYVPVDFRDILGVWKDDKEIIPF